MILNGEFITHKAYGRGQIIAHENDSVTVLFTESGETKRFIYPSAVGTFLSLDDDQKALEFKAFADTLAHDQALARKDEADRQQAEKKAAEDYAKKLKKATKKPKKPAEPIQDEDFF
jgi:hypothetical protein